MKEEPKATQEELIKAAMHRIPFPESLAKDVDSKTEMFLRRNWSGDVERFLENMENELGITLDMIQSHKH